MIIVASSYLECYRNIYKGPRECIASISSEMKVCMHSSNLRYFHTVLKHIRCKQQAEQLKNLMIYSLAAGQQ